MPSSDHVGLEVVLTLVCPLSPWSLRQEDEDEDEDAAEGLDDAELKDQLLQAQASMSQPIPADVHAEEASDKERPPPVDTSVPSPTMSPEVASPAAWEGAWDEEHMQPSLDQQESFNRDSLARSGEVHPNPLHLSKSVSVPDRLGAWEDDRASPTPHTGPSHVVIETGTPPLPCSSFCGVLTRPRVCGAETRKIELQVLSHTMVLDDGPAGEDGEGDTPPVLSLSSSDPHSAPGGLAMATQSLPRAAAVKRAQSQGLDGRRRIRASKALFEQVGHAHM